QQRELLRIGEDHFRHARLDARCARLDRELIGPTQVPAYPADMFDVMDTDTEDIIRTVLSNVAYYRSGKIA
ncbi:MAG: hypothetical protein IJI15_02280, partial [Atopobiaceae bacterium]|nr:hypothetical protein [Atopobiaceae bacterium]